MNEIIDRNDVRFALVNTGQVAQLSSPQNVPCLTLIEIPGHREIEKRQRMCQLSKAEFGVDQEFSCGLSRNNEQVFAASLPD